MKMRLFILMWVIALCSYNNSRVEAKVMHDDPEEIEWEGQGDRRSVFPVGGFVDDGLIVIYLYEKPEKTKITIVDEKDLLVYQTVIFNSEEVVFDLSIWGDFTILVEYDNCMYKGIYVDRR